MHETTTFAELGLSPAVAEALDALGYERPSPIQARAIPPVLAGRDLLGVAQTGTGKTAAFALPLLSTLEADTTAPQVLVLTPTRELAIQVAEAFRRYATRIDGFRVAPIYGGQEYTGQLRALQRGVHVVVGTPGRITDHVKRGSLRLDAVRTVVLDEADEMLRMGFLEEVEWILEQTPSSRQTALFSATMSPPIQRVAERYLDDPTEVRIKAETATVRDTEQRACLVRPNDKLDALTRLLETLEFDGMLIFVRTRNSTVELKDRLEARGFACDALSGEMTQQARERTVGRLRSGTLDVLVATDVAARGIDVSRISHVINYDVPYDIEAYIHRVGRTGRAGRKGSAITFVAPRETRLLRAIERATRSPIDWLELPGTEQVAERRVGAFKEKMKAILDGDEELEFFRGLIREFAAEHGCSTEDAAAALAFMQQRERPLRPQPETIHPPRRPAAPRQTDGRHQPRHRNGGRPRRPAGPDAALERYRIRVGREHGVNPGHIVGAIANEIGLDSAQIGRIELYRTHSTVELPRGLPPHVLRHLQKVRIFQRPLGIESDGGHDSRRAAPHEAKRGSKFAGARRLLDEGKAPPKRKGKQAGRPGAFKARRLAKAARQR